MALLSKHKSTPNQSTQYLTFTETTGVFGVLNPGGYGTDQTPTGTRKKTDPQFANFSILNYNGTLTYEGTNSSVTTEELYATTFNSTAAQTIANGTSQSFDLAALIGINYIDAVYKSVYYNWFAGSDVVNIGSAFNILNVPDYNEFTNAKYISLPTLNGVGGVFEVLEVNTNNTIKINGEVLAGDDLAYAVSYESTAYFANTYNINKCLHAKIAQLSLSTCSCKTKSTEKLYEAVMMYMSIQPNMDLGKYTKAQEIINALTIYCNGGECNC